MAAQRTDGPARGVFKIKWKILYKVFWISVFSRQIRGVRDEDTAGSDVYLRLNIKL